MKLGSKGPEVGKLQEKLQQFGYDPGPVDQIFGYLTQEALQFFQRDYRLQIDGIAGKQVFLLLKQETLPITRRVHTVRSNETLVDISQLYNVGPQAFREHRSKAKLYPGQQVIFFDREVWGILNSDLASHDSYTKNIQSLTGVVIPIEIGKSIPTIEKSSLTNKIARIDLASDQQLTEIHRILTKRKLRQQFFQFCVDKLNEVDGLYFPWDHLSRVDGGRYLKLIKKIKKKARKKRILVILDPQMPCWNVLGGLDFRAVSEVVDQVVIKLRPTVSAEAIIDKHKSECLVHKMLNYIPAYKLLISLPVSTYLWNLNSPEEEPKVLSYAEGMSLIFRKGARLENDEDKGAYYRFYDNQQEMLVRIPSLEKIRQVVDLVNRYNLAGILIDSLGNEDKRLWLSLHSHFRIRKKL